MVEPAYDFILSNPNAFSPGKRILRKEAAELIFTDKTLETMLKEASQEATLASLWRLERELKHVKKGGGDPRSINAGASSKKRGIGSFSCGLEAESWGWKRKTIRCQILDARR